jgi:hypothetical protein
MISAEIDDRRSGIAGVDQPYRFHDICGEPGLPAKQPDAKERLC